METRNITKWKDIMQIIFFINLLFAGDCSGRNSGMGGGSTPNMPPDSGTDSAAPVQVNVTGNQIELDNGIIQVTFSIPEGFIIGIRFDGIDNVLDVTNRLSDRGYWDIASVSNPDNDDSNEIGLGGRSFKIISQTPDQAEISFFCQRTSSLPLQVEIRYVLLRGRSGFYSYAIFERAEGLPPLDVDQIRTVFKLQPTLFTYMAISDKIQRIMPTLRDRETGQRLAYKEAVRITKPTNSKIKGQVDDKYQYSCEDKDNKLHGWISFKPAVGIWLITPSDEFRMGGPLKQDLTSHVGPTMISMFHSTHYGGNDLIMRFKNGEPWKKVFGPYLVHLNSAHGEADPVVLWQQAKEQMQTEVKNWPYEFPLSPDFPKANQRGSVVGRLFVNNGSKVPTPANFGWVGLAAPGEPGSWQYEMKGYQFWIQTDSEGRFLIPNVRVGIYNFFAWVPGFIGDYKSAAAVNIVAGKQINIGDQVFVPPRSGPTLWEIGFPDRSAAEFFVPDPTPHFTNPVFINNAENKYRQYGLWDRYTDLYPRHDLVYTVGVSDFRKHWFFAHVLRRIGKNYQPTTWHIVFPLLTIAPNTTYTLQIALASATQSELQVRINNPDVQSKPLFTTLLIGRDNAIARHGIHGLYRLYTIGVPSSSLKRGHNTVFLTQSRNNEMFRGIMYDYIRLEGPPSSQIL
ncbi:unnamed protein product [Amaranthus hypochondriacus]